MARLTRPVVVLLLRAAETFSQDAVGLKKKERQDLDRGLEWLRAKAAGPAAKAADKEVPIATASNGADEDGDV